MLCRTCIHIFKHHILEFLQEQCLHHQIYYEKPKNFQFPKYFQGIITSTVHYLYLNSRSHISEMFPNHQCIKIKLLYDDTKKVKHTCTHTRTHYITSLSLGSHLVQYSNFCIILTNRGIITKSDTNITVVIIEGTSKSHNRGYRIKSSSYTTNNPSTTTTTTQVHHYHFSMHYNWSLHSHKNLS